MGFAVKHEDMNYTQKKEPDIKRVVRKISRLVKENYDVDSIPSPLKHFLIGVISGIERNADGKSDLAIVNFLKNAEEIKLAGGALTWDDWQRIGHKKVRDIGHKISGQALKGLNLMNENPLKFLGKKVLKSAWPAGLGLLSRTATQVAAGGIPSWSRKEENEVEKALRSGAPVG